MIDALCQRTGEGRHRERILILAHAEHHTAHATILRWQVLELAVAAGKSNGLEPRTMRGKRARKHAVERLLADDVNGNGAFDRRRETGANSHGLGLVECWIRSVGNAGGRWQGTC